MISSHQEKAGFLLVTVEEESTTTSSSFSSRGRDGPPSNTFHHHHSPTIHIEEHHYENKPLLVDEYKHHVHHDLRSSKSIRVELTTHKTNKRQYAVDDQVASSHHHHKHATTSSVPIMKIHVRDEDPTTTREASSSSARVRSTLGKRNLTEFKGDQHHEQHKDQVEVVDENHRVENYDDDHTPSSSSSPRIAFYEISSSSLWQSNLNHPEEQPNHNVFEGGPPPHEIAQHEHEEQPPIAQQENVFQQVISQQQPHFYPPPIVVGYGNNGTLYVQSQNTGRFIPAIVSPKKKKPKTKHPINAELIITKTNVVRIRKKKGQTVVNCDVYVGNRCFHGGWRLQESKWANPFEKLPKPESLEKYREYILSQPKLKQDLIELKGKTLGCFCERHERPCHADVLCELVEELYP
ncbi:hypothetical protein FDP41_009609 [Naegleria fowleri]|uniref:DUF4326 domain-containing protein n=1 Tax=Naegleria fowleri TaxID=5763 RepID=A0A6A5AUM3_NAEFO|nr:uncharacterized protein FDP41_009609 [Naegleria fowleri]KAF0971913.1 hypothetical protein FDP41_009609 [Naegleria fowleri]CAG4719110.1 unnamed protein product [Naegleria fowleri]